MEQIPYNKPNLLVQTKEAIRALRNKKNHTKKLKVKSSMMSACENSVRTCRHDFSSSAWEKGINTIESILEPGGKAEEALTHSQKEGLEVIKRLLLVGTRESMLHVPTSLVESTRNQDLPFEDRNLACNLMENYSGVRRRGAVTRHFQTLVETTQFVQDISEGLRDYSAPVFELTEMHELGLESRKRLRKLLSWDSLCRWDFNIMEVSKECGGHPLLFVGWALLASPYSHQTMEVSCGIQCELKNKGYFFLDDLGVEEEKLCEFLRVVEAKYNKNPYHNNTHAADVTQTVHCLIQMERKVLATQKLESFATIVAAVCHDICHPGLNNSYQISARTNLALQYNDIAVLENMHAFEAFRHILGDHPQPKLDILSGLKKEQVNDFRKLVINLILQTDMTKHFSEINVIKGLLVSSPLDDLLKEVDTRAKLMGFVLHMADISNPAKPTPLAIEWADRCLAEFFAQGDKEKARGLPVSPLCDRSSTSRPESQIGFIKFIVQPSFKVLSAIVPAVEDEVMPIIAQNVEYWEKQKAEED
mmetsp:Transcript_17792/g.26110  ORF Transcript_17792/g.26110 Transcript_17792/m.26110 type:complete len:532 (+) Transcript_17792:18-1613(+)|eukprot:CAMPEP_0195516264 /NCGR_PEP_ID=MMETSP0794_2-20130614/7038_1 /TAXON_ID=515487 /ORGANISM="Stephanopyxis turris, Strain CCMP 815" /LENGTH=531 /DNA_ID=CAMNT_0040644819 /DNA_START=16 /DNA_END=1611 /DNA_ORIENTATION=+